MSTDIPAGLLSLQQEVPSHLIGKLPKVMCPECRDKKNRGACQQHPKTQCPVCKGYLTPKHTHIDYVGHAETTSKLLEVDALWNWEPLAFGADGLPAFDVDGGLWIRLTVCGVSRLGYGTADNANGFKAKGDIRKEIIGDAIRNAAMRFGWALDLWAKADLHETAERAEQPQEAPRRSQRSQVQRDKPSEPGGEWTGGQDAPAAPAQSAGATMPQLNMLNTLISKKYGNLPRDQRLGTVAKLAGRNLASSKDLTKREASGVIEALTALADFDPQQYVGQEMVRQHEEAHVDLSDASPAAVAEAGRLEGLPGGASVEDVLRDRLESAGDPNALGAAWRRVLVDEERNRINAAEFERLSVLRKKKLDEFGDRAWTAGVSAQMDAAA